MIKMNGGSPDGAGGRSDDAENHDDAAVGHDGTGDGATNPDNLDSSQEQKQESESAPDWSQPDPFVTIASTDPARYEALLRGQQAMDCVKLFAQHLKPHHIMHPAPKTILRLINEGTAPRLLNEARILHKMLCEARQRVDIARRSASAANRERADNADYIELLYAGEVVDICLSQTVPDVQFVACDEKYTPKRDAHCGPLDELDHLLALSEQLVLELERIVGP